MDYGANLCDHKRLREISCKYNIPIIHDAAHSFSSKYENSFIETSISLQSLVLIQSSALLVSMVEQLFWTKKNTKTKLKL